MLRSGACSRPGLHHHAPSVAPHRHRARQPPDPADEDLARRFATGDADAVRELYARYGGSMLTAALHLLGGDRRLAEEVVQAAILKAWRASATFDVTRRLAPWLYAIVRRCAIDIRRHEQRHQVVSVDTASDEPAADDDELESAAAAWDVREALRSLPAKEYEVVRLTYFGGLTHVAIAQRLGIPVGTVKSRNARAHQRLRTKLGPRLAS